MERAELEHFAGQEAKRIFGPDVISRVLVESKPSWEGEDSWKILVVWRPGAAVPSGDAAIEFLHTLSKALLAQADMRFPYVTHADEADIAGNAA